MQQQIKTLSLDRDVVRLSLVARFLLVESRLVVLEDSSAYFQATCRRFRTTKAGVQANLSTAVVLFTRVCLSLQPFRSVKTVSSPGSY